jgi:hypothetical protein
MKIVRIFTSDNSDDGIWSIHLDGSEQSEFDKFFDSMNDIEWLYHFFEENKADLTSGFFGNLTVGEVVLKTFEEIEVMEDVLYDYAEQGFAKGNANLQLIFKPLNNFEYGITLHQKSKARIRRGWLRVYAIRLSENCYLVTGGAIKLTLDMKRTHLQYELTKLEQAKLFLRNNGIDYPEDLNTHQDD